MDGTSYKSEHDGTSNKSEHGLRMLLCESEHVSWMVLDGSEHAHGWR